MYCRYCGTEIKGTENFCNKCGKKLKDNIYNDKPTDLIALKKEESKKGYWTYGVIIIIVVILISGLWFYQQVRQREALRDVIVSVDDVGVGSIGLTGATLNIRLNMYNPNSITATLDRVDYQIYGNNNFIGNGNINQRIDIPPGRTEYVTTDFHLSYGGALRVIWSAIRQGDVNWRVTGIAHFDTPLGTLNIPFDK